MAVAHGDGIGPEIMDATLRVLDAAGAGLVYDTIEIGKKVYERGVSAGIEASSWDTLRKHRVFLKAPITTPQGGGYKSLNVTTRKTLGLYANVRPCVAYAPFVGSRHPGMDVVIVRENEEDTYGGIEHRQTAEVTQCLKLISRPGCEKIVRHAFEYARAAGRKRVSCFTKDNIMKATDGLFHRVFDEIRGEYPEIESDHWIIDIGAAMLADRPERFDVILTLNLYGDVLSDIAAQIAGSVGLCGTSNIGDTCSMFEAIHGSAPDIAGRDVANPTGLLLAAVQMLVHLNKPGAAEKIHNAVLRTIEDGVHTADLHDGRGHDPVGTRAFADAVIQRLGQRPEHLPAAVYAGVADRAAPGVGPATREKPVKALVGVDVFLDWDPAERDPDALAAELHAAADGQPLQLQMITNRGVKVWPEGFPETFCTDHWRCRFVPRGGGEASHRQVLGLLTRLADAGLDFIKTEHLCTFDGEAGFSLGQGQ
ncbi:isocitrate dehydrogenase [Phycisphaera mikurensis NBRC 102666]|uniref:Isocitrate dehydrogenase [NADP] n=1 Tax=Phycisphaera mikurensis (strain NBRC 102666 / KCTC 22515 / FYK2301M01) TaxID=1142394 RepID=I0IJ73_PHYMF|nr:isocitrate dehydrogenase [Phycisphaera mikurensis NBRC 102666]